MQEYINSFVVFMEKRRSASDNTIRIYQTTLEKFVSQFGIRIPADITLKVIKKYCSYMDNQNLHPNTKNLNLIVVRAFLKFLKKEEGIVLFDLSEIELYKKPRRVEITLPSDEELTRFLAPTGNARDDLIVRMMYDSGLRIAELVALENRPPVSSFTIHGKGDKTRIIFLTPGTVALWEAYKPERRPTEKALFVNELGRRLQKRPIQQMITDRAKAVGIATPFSAHTLRHLFATNMLRAGAQIYEVQKFLGHSSITTTERYLHMTNNHLQEVYNKYKS